jgi:hypothetical protein
MAGEFYCTACGNVGKARVRNRGSSASLGNQPNRRLSVTAVLIVAIGVCLARVACAQVAPNDVDQQRLAIAQQWTQAQRTAMLQLVDDGLTQATNSYATVTSANVVPLHDNAWLVCGIANFGSNGVIGMFVWDTRPPGTLKAVSTTEQLVQMGCGAPSVVLR